MSRFTVFLTLTLLALPVSGEIYFVNTIFDELNTNGNCSLREALTGAGSIGDLPQTAALLAGPMDNGGSTPTCMPLLGSPLIDGGNPSGCLDETNSPLTEDQRGIARPLDGDGTAGACCDMGAVEVEPGHALIFADGFEGGSTLFWSSSAF